MRVLRKYFRQQLCFTNCRKQNPNSGEKDITLLRTLLAIRKKLTKAKFLEGNKLSIDKSGSFKNPFARTTTMSEFGFRRIILLSLQAIL